MASTTRPDARRMRTTGLVPLGKAWVSVGGHQAEAVVEAPHRDVTGTGREQLAQGHLGVGVGTEEAGAGGEAPRLAEVREHGALVGPLLEAAVELGQGDHRALELTGQELEPTGDLGHLDLAALGVGAAGHQLDVVDHHHVEAADLAAQAPGLGPDLHDGDVGVVVDPDLGVAQAAHGRGDGVPVRVRQTAVADLGGVDPGVGAQDALDQLDLAHLQGEQEDRVVASEGGVGRHAQGQGRLAHGRAGPHHHQGAGLEPGGHLVEVVVAGGGAGDLRAPVVQLLDAGEGVAQQVGEAGRAPLALVAGDVEHQRLGLVDHLADVLGQAEGGVRDRAGGADEAPEQGVVADDAGVVGGVGRAGGVGLEVDQGGGAARPVEQVAAAQLVGHGDRVGHLALRGEDADGLVDVDVGGPVEDVGPGDDLGRGRHRVAGQEQGAQEGPLGVDVVGRHPAPAPRRRAARAVVVVGGRLVVEHRRVGHAGSLVGWWRSVGTGAGQVGRTDAPSRAGPGRSPRRPRTGRAPSPTTQPDRACGSLARSSCG